MQMACIIEISELGNRSSGTRCCWPTPIFGHATLERRESRERLTREIARLKPEEQELLEMRFWEEE